MNDNNIDLVDRLHDVANDWRKLSDPENAAVTDEAAARIVALEQALREIEELNKLDPDENGHRWDNSDLVAQTILSAFGALK